MGTLFVAGVYGVGKSTLCSELASKLQVPSFSASDLISKVNNESYGANKAVSDKDVNQDILTVEVGKQLANTKRLLLAGHFCIFTKDNHVDILPFDVFKQLSITKILLLEADTDRVLSNLSIRDNRIYTNSQITALQNAEYEMANKVASLIECDIIIHRMRFNKTDADRCLSYIGKGDW